MMPNADWFDKINPDKLGLRIVGSRGGTVTIMRDPNTDEHYLFILDYLLERGERQPIRDRYEAIAGPSLLSTVRH